MDQRAVGAIADEYKVAVSAWLAIDLIACGFELLH